MEDAESSANGRNFHVADYTIFIGVLGVSLAIGIYHALTGGKQKTTKEFLMADRQMRTLPVALSILVSFVSGILVLGTPAEMYTRGTQLFMRTIGYCIACVLSVLLFVPLFFSLKVTSSFEYLEKRYHSKTLKLIGTVSMLIGNLFYMGLVIYAPATALEAATGFNIWGSVVSSGVIATVYTTLGGLKAVIWTDVFQAVVMVTGMLVIVVKGMMQIGGPEQMWNISEEGGRLTFFNFDPDPTQRLSFWSTVFGGAFSTLAIFGIGQTSVQRFCTLPTLGQAKKAVFLNIPFLIIVNILSSLVGLVIYAHYAGIKCDPLKSKAINNANQLVPYFIIDVLNYPGLPGAFLAVLFSGALSSLSSSLNSAAAVTWQDILQYFFTKTSELKKTLVTKLLVVIYGFLAISMAFLARLLGGHVLWASLSFSGATMGPTLGIFLLGALIPFANAKGAITGILISSALSLWITVGAFIVKPHRDNLPTSVEGCHSSINDSHLMMLYSGNASELSYYYVSERYNNNSYALLTSDHGTTFGDTSTEFGHLAEDRPVFGLNKMYEISFLWYCAIGSLTAFFVGIVVSWLTKSNEDKEVDPRLIIPVFYYICCCLPKKKRENLLRQHFIKSHLIETSDKDQQNKREECIEKEQSSAVSIKSEQSVDLETGCCSGKKNQSSVESVKRPESLVSTL